MFRSCSYARFVRREEASESPQPRVPPGSAQCCDACAFPGASRCEQVLDCSGREGRNAFIRHGEVLQLGARAGVEFGAVTHRDAAEVARQRGHVGRDRLACRGHRNFLFSAMPPRAPCAWSAEAGPEWQSAISAAAAGRSARSGS